MKTKKTILKFIPIAVIALIFAGCQKYEDGPAFSIRTRTERVANTWQIDNYTINETDWTSLVGGYTETFSKDGNYSYTWGILNGTGTWKFANSQSDIQLTGSSNQEDRTLTILKLEEEQFWYYYMEGSDRHEFHLTEK
jgi:hypothetical protein